MKKVLLTGSSGFIGRNLCDQLRGSYKLYTPSSKELNLLDEVKVASYVKKHAFDVVIHAATHDATITSEKDTSLVLSNNLRMFTNIFRCRHMYGRMFYFGSGAEYDMRHYVPKMPESYFDTFVPVDQYGYSKYLMGLMSHTSQNVYDITLFGVFGKYEDWRIRFLSNAIARSIYGMDMTLSQNVRFDYLHIDDLARVMKRFIDASSLRYHQYNVCSSSVNDLASLADIVRAYSKKPVSLRIAHSGMKPEYSGDNSRLLKEFSDIKFTSIEQAIHKLYDWYAANKRHIDPKQFAR